MKILSVLLAVLFYAFTTNAQKIIRVTEFGAKGSDTLDDTKAIQAAIDHAASSGSGIVYFPKGTYYIFNQKIPGKAVCLLGNNNVSFEGESRDESILRLKGNQPGFSSIISLLNVQNINITNLTFDGNYLNQATPSHPNEHLHGIYMDKVTHVMIRNCNFYNTGGDGLGMRGVDVPSTDILIENCNFDNNQRNGLTLGSGYKNITIRNCYFGKKIKNSPIDSEPSSGYCGDVLIENNNIETDNLLTVGAYKDSLAQNIIIRNNKMLGSFFIIYAKNVLIEHNTFTNFPQRAAVTILRRNSDIIIRNNDITSVGKPAFVITYSAGMYSQNILINSNTIHFNADSDACFDIKGCDDIKITNNSIFNTAKSTLVNLYATRTISDFEFSNNEAGFFSQNFNLRTLGKNEITNLRISKNKLGNKEIMPDKNKKINLVNPFIKND